MLIGKKNQVTNKYRFEIISRIFFHDGPWWRVDIDMVSTLLTLYEGNPPVTGALPLQNGIKVDFLTSCWKTVGASVVLKRLLWRHCNDYADFLLKHSPHSKVRGANMRPTWGRQDPGGPHGGPINLVIWVCIINTSLFGTYQYLFYASYIIYHISSHRSMMPSWHGYAFHSIVTEWIPFTKGW